MRNFLQILIAATVLIFCAANAQAAQEEILSFKSDITINADATVTVVETIQVRSTGSEIKRGIYRDFPTDYENGQGYTIRAKFDVRSVKRSGYPIDFWIEPKAGYQRVYMGNKNKLIGPGIYVFELTYTTDQQIGYFDEFDELYWNVTGDGWSFPILKAEAVIHIPHGAYVLQKAAYTGRRGTAGRDFTISTMGNGELKFQTTKTLHRGEGLTVAIGWPKGFVQQPSVSDEVKGNIEANFDLVAAITGLLLVMTYYLFAWVRVGRDPESGPIIPLFAPPKDLSPAASCYLSHMKFTDTAFSAAIVSMAVKGMLTIDEMGGSFILSRISKSTNLASPGERALAQMLFSKNDTVGLDNENHEVINEARSALSRALEQEFESIHFKVNFSYLVVGIGLTLLTAWTVASQLPGQMLSKLFEPVITVIVLSIFIIKFERHLFGVFRHADGLMRDVSNTFKLILHGPMILLALPFLVYGISFAAGTFGIVLPYSIVIVLLMALMTPIFHHLLKAPTLKGRTLLDKIGGFKLYLSTAEKERLEFIHPPEETPELFEAYLPYALALDVGHEWSSHFTHMVTSAGIPIADNYQPRWYRGRRWRIERVSDIGHGLSSSLATARHAPSSSSGSIGGGFSGGGGGGGGGGGF